MLAIGRSLSNGLNLSKSSMQFEGQRDLDGTPRGFFSRHEVEGGAMPLGSGLAITSPTVVGVIHADPAERFGIS